MKISRIGSFVLLCLSQCLWVGAADAEQTMKAFAALDENNVTKMNFALDFAERMVSENRSAKFEILAGGKGVFMVLKDKSPVLDRVESLAAKYPSLSLSACTQTTDKMRKSLGADSVKLARGVREVDCDVRMKELRRDDWYRISLSDID